LKLKKNFWFTEAFQATVACGGQAIPDPPSTGPLPPEFPSEDDGTIDCASNAAAGVDMADCTSFNYGE
jgi:hypothetical protein